MRTIQGRADALFAGAREPVLAIFLGFRAALARPQKGYSFDRETQPPKSAALNTHKQLQLRYRNIIKKKKLEA